MFVSTLPRCTSLEQCTFSDYRGLKKRITAIRIAQEQAGATPLLLPTSPVLDTHPVETHAGRHDTQDDVPAVSAEESLTQLSHADKPVPSIHSHTTKGNSQVSKNRVLSSRPSLSDFR